MYSPSLLFHLAVILFSVSGFTVAYVIHHHKTKKKPLVCPLRSRCDLVTESKFATFMGMHNEQLGMAYYAIVALLYGVTIFFPAGANSATGFRLILLPAAAFVYSIYLVLLQAFVIQEWCAWCLTSALISVLIFFTALIAAPMGLF